VPRSRALPHHITEDRHILHCRRSRQQHILPAVIVTQHRPNVGVAPPPSSSVPPPSVPTFQVPTSSPRHHLRPFHPRAHTHDPQVLCLPSMLPNKLCMSHPSPAPPFHPRPRRPGGDEEQSRRRGGRKSKARATPEHTRGGRYQEEQGTTDHVQHTPAFIITAGPCRLPRDVNLYSTTSHPWLASTSPSLGERARGVLRLSG
jgi:hypothetical protein